MNNILGNIPIIYRMDVFGQLLGNVQAGSLRQLRPGLIEGLTAPFMQIPKPTGDRPRSIALSCDESQIVRQEHWSDLFWISASLTIHPFFPSKGTIACLSY